MPIYEYQCSKCHNIFEEWVKSFDSPEHEPCPKCGADAARIVSNTTFVLKGGGWYVTEYGNQKKDHESGAGAPGEGHGPDMGADTGTDAAGKSSSETAAGAKSETPAASDKAPAAKESSPASKDSASSQKSAGAGKEGSSSPAAKGSAKAKNTAAA